MRKLYGKRFVTRDDAEPIVCFAEDGSLVASVDFGVARLRELSFRGTSSAGMVYDQQPWIDYFRKLDDDTLVAMIDIKGKPIDIGFFMLAAKGALSRAIHNLPPGTCGLGCGVHERPVRPLGISPRNVSFRATTHELPCCFCLREEGGGRVCAPCRRLCGATSR